MKLLLGAPIIAYPIKFIMKLLYYIAFLLK